MQILLSSFILYSGDYNHSPIHQGTSGTSSSASGLHNISAGTEQHYLQHPTTPAGVAVKSESPIMMSTDQQLSQNVSQKHIILTYIVCVSVFLGASYY